MNGIERISAERERQIDVEGWTLEHDNQHKGGELARAAAFYALPLIEDIDAALSEGIYWPFDEKECKPSPENRIRELEKSGALIAAEIDRLLRLEYPKL